MIEIELSNGDRYVSYGNLEYSRAGKSQKHLSAPDAVASLHTLSVG
jgi:hypothetical protein